MAEPNSPREKFLDELADQAGRVEGLANAVDLIVGNSLEDGHTIHHGSKDATALIFLASEAHMAALKLLKMANEDRPDA